MIMSPGANAFLDASAHYHPMNTGDFTQSLGVLYSPCRRCAQRVMLPRTLIATLPCRSAAACRHLAATGTVPIFLRTVNHEKPADLFVVSLDACDGAGIDCVAAAFEIAIASPFAEARERPLLRRLARDPPFSTERRTYKRRSGRMMTNCGNTLFKFRPFAVDILGAYGVARLPVITARYSGPLVPVL
jgi:hypothetical protein